MTMKVMTTGWSCNSGYHPIRGALTVAVPGYPVKRLES